MLTTTKNKMTAYAQTLPPSSARAQCYQIANLTAGQSIAKALENDHRSQDGHLRAAKLMVAAGAATEKAGKKNCYGVFTFEDGSSF